MSWVSIGIHYLIYNKLHGCTRKYKNERELIVYRHLCSNHMVGLEKLNSEKLSEKDMQTEICNSISCTREVWKEWFRDCKNLFLIWKENSGSRHNC